ncbi:MAG: DUF2723 domain-containing protein [Fibromonadaceae bacterium]|jgi:hypothetical protein|nr:DUF2723 domain-containing protein [Fibromonadaceae bacterium]
MGKIGERMVYRITIVLLGFIGYGLTLARSLSFWDCGEYITAANVLGIPHPPGNPLFIMLGRVFILLFGWLKGPAFAMNLMSAISSILCCLLIFEITKKILPKESPSLLAFFAASISLFGDTFWFNAVEAGAYSISMCIIMLQIWATLKWKETDNNKYLLLIIYIALLGLGFHTFCLLPLPAIFVFVLFKRIKFPIKFFFAAAFLIVLGFSSQLYLPIRSSTEPILNENNPAELENFLEVLGRKQYGNMNMFERALYRRAALANQLGFSENIGYLGYHLNQWLPAPLGAQNPGVWVEGLPGKLQFFHRIIFEFLIIAVFTGVWLYRKNSSVLLIAFMFLLSSIGLALYLNLADGTRTDSYNAKRWNASIKELRKFVPDSIPNLPSISELNAQYSFYTALPASMREMWINGAPKAKGLKTFFTWQDILEEQGKEMMDLPRKVHREVRNRDYFFTPAFLFFAIMAAVACSAGLQRMSSARWKKIAIYGLAFAWLVPFISNFSSHNRSQDFIARDFAINILNSVPQNGILITYGDNDTFPLWYMQMVEKYRTDVVVINESLSYSDWYRKQVLENYPDLNVVESEGNFIKGIIEKHWPEKSINFMIGANPHDYKEFSENMPLIGLVRNLGMDNQEADSLLIENLATNYQYSELKARGQEANEQTINIYRYLAKLALMKEKEPSEEQQTTLFKLIGN